MLHSLALPVADPALERLIPEDAPTRPRAVAVLDGVLARMAWTDDAERPGAVLVIEDADGPVTRASVRARRLSRTAGVAFCP